MPDKEWREWSVYVLKTLERQEEMHMDLLDAFQVFRVDMTKEIATLKTTARIWGAGAGLLLGAVAGFIVSVLA
jgi:hypothetical protein